MLLRLVAKSLTLLMVLLIGLSAFGQGLEEGMLFAPADISPFGNGIQPKEGYFFVFDGLRWSISAPSVAIIGKPDFVRRDVFRSDPTQVAQPFNQANTHDTGQYISAFTEGNRLEFGRISGHKGWMVGGYRLQSQSQTIVASDVNVAFEDFDIATGFKTLDGLVESLDPTAPPPDPTDPAAPSGATITEFRSLPVIFDEMSFKNRVETWSVELMGMHRFHQLHRGGVIELFAGARFLEFDDSFDVIGLADEPDTTGTGTGTTPPVATPAAAPAATTNVVIPPILANSTWNTMAQNHIIGPQVGVRYFRKWNRWMVSSEGRFMAGFNFQNIRQNGVLGSELIPPGILNQPYLQGPMDINHTEFISEWSPLVELRAEARYQITRSVSFRFGWTGLWMDGIARGSSMVNYELAQHSRPNPVDFEYMGILTQNNRQSILVTGLTLGIDVNR